MRDYRQRFYVEDAPVRGEVVHLEQSLSSVLQLRDYPVSLQQLLAEMMVGAALLIGTFKIKGRLSIQAQGEGDLEWAMAECNDKGELRALAKWKDSPFWQEATTADEALGALNPGVLFINIEPEQGERYQGIISLDQPNLSALLTQYYVQSAQLPTKIQLAANLQQAGGMLVQLLPHTEEEKAQLDADLWPRIEILSSTLKSDELYSLQGEELLYRLFHDEHIKLDHPQSLYFHCSCSKEKCENALTQVGLSTVEEILQENGEINMDCQFCNAPYRFSPAEALGLFDKTLT